MEQLARVDRRGGLWWVVYIPEGSLVHHLVVWSRPPTLVEQTVSDLLVSHDERSLKNVEIQLGE
jgi:hypothetical protein